MKKNLISLLMSLMLTSGILICQTNSETSWNIESATIWYNSGAWNKGLSLKAFKGIDVVEFAKQYHKNNTYWKKAFGFLINTNLDTLSVGKYNLMGDTVYVSVTNNKTKTFDETKYEAHKKYIDLQYVIKGMEKMGVATVSKGIVKEEYNEKKDVGFYSFAENECKYYTAHPDTFLLFFPSQAHRPNIHIDGCDTDKKLVIKIKAD